MVKELIKQTNTLPRKAKPVEMRELERKKRPVRQRKKRSVRKKGPARKVRQRVAPREARYNPLLALLMFLYMLKLIDQNTLKRIQDALYPKKRPKRKARRTRGQRRRTR